MSTEMWTEQNLQTYGRAYAAAVAGEKTFELPRELARGGGLSAAREAYDDATRDKRYWGEEPVIRSYQPAVRPKASATQPEADALHESEMSTRALVGAVAAVALLGAGTAMLYNSAAGNLGHSTSSTEQCAEKWARNKVRVTQSGDHLRVIGSTSTVTTSARRVVVASGVHVGRLKVCGAGNATVVRGEVDTLRLSGTHALLYVRGGEIESARVDGAGCEVRAPRGSIDELAAPRCDIRRE